MIIKILGFSLVILGIGLLVYQGLHSQPTVIYSDLGPAETFVKDPEKISLISCLGLASLIDGGFLLLLWRRFNN